MLLRKNGHIQPRSACFVLLVMLLTACSTTSVAPSPTAPQIPTRVTQATTPTVPGARNCHPPSPIVKSNVGLPEVHGTATNTELRALLFAPLLAKQDIKIVWSMTGSGDFRIIAIGPDGMKVQPTFGPGFHGGSNWVHPGPEWGTGFTFPVAGCWDMHATRDNAIGDIWLVIG